MSQVSAKAKCFVEEKQRLQQIRSEVMKFKGIDRSYTSFGGNGILTKEQYEEGMQLFKKMRNCRYW